jgi:hypothetical protein
MFLVGMGFRYGFTVRGVDAGGIVKVFELWVFCLEMVFLSYCEVEERLPFWILKPGSFTRNNGQQDL